MSYTTIDKPTDYFNTVLYTGNGASSRDITGVGFQPDFTWIKQRNGTFSHVLGNSVSGDNKFLTTNSSSAESTDSDKFRTFVSDGFQVGSHNGVNGSSNTYVGWSWLSGTTFTNDASSTGVGNLDSAGSASDISGLSVVTYTGGTGSAATIKHGLSSAPKMMWVKPLSGSGVWLVYHKDLPIKGQLQLQSSDAAYSHSGNIYWNGTHPTSSVFSIGTSGAVNASENYVVYCFADVKGYSKIGSYSGNSNADGIFVYTGFKPAFIITKASTTGQSWQLYDTKRNPFNQSNKVLFPNQNYAEQDDSSAAAIDILSNGFKQRVNDAGGNGSGNDYIYMAFAESPFVTSTGIPTTAR